MKVLSSGFLFILSTCMCQTKTTSTISKNVDFAPQYMNDLYDILLENDDSKPDHEMDIGEEIYCLLPLKGSQSKQTRQGPFIYSYLFKGYHDPLAVAAIKKVEFRVFKITPRILQHQMKGRFYRADVTIKSQSYSKSTLVLVSSTGFGWVSIDVTANFKDYLNHRVTNESKLSVKINIVDNKLHPRMMFITSVDKQTRGIFVIFSNAIQISMDIEKDNGMSNISNHHYDQKNCLNKNKSNDNISLLKRIKRASEHIQSGCRLEKLEVDVADVLPDKAHLFLTKTLQINKCVGTCDLSQGQSSNIKETSHAEIRRAYEHQTGDSIGNSLCCSPRKYHTLIYLFRIDDMIVQKKFRNGKVVSCYCT